MEKRKKAQENAERIQYFTLPHLLRQTPVDSTSKLPNISFWTTLDARVRWSPPDSARLQQLNHCCRLGLGIRLEFRLGLGLGIGVRGVYIYCGWRSQQLFHVESRLSLPESVESMDSSKPMCHMIIFCNFCFPESARLQQSRWGSVQSSEDCRNYHYS